MRKFIRWSGLGACFAALTAFLQGCTQNEELLALLLLLLMLGGCSYQLTVEGTGFGTVAGADGLIQCDIINSVASGTCQADIDSGQLITLTATPSAGYSFDSWINCPTAQNNQCNFQEFQDITITANFVQQFQLTVSGNGVNAVSGFVTGAAPSNINCTIGSGADTGTCTEFYNAGTVVVLTATPQPPEIFDTWNICPAPAGNVCTVVMNSDVAVDVEFVPPL